MANLNDVMAQLRIDELRREAEAERVACRMLAKRGGRRRSAQRSPVHRAARSLRTAAAGLAYRVLSRTSAVLGREIRE